jgi:hypothetical protein
MATAALECEVDRILRLRPPTTPFARHVGLPFLLTFDRFLLIIKMGNWAFVLNGGNRLTP